MNLLMQLAELKLLRGQKVANQKVLLDDIRRLCAAGLRDDPRVQDLYNQVYAFERAYRDAVRRFDRALWDYLAEDV